MTLLARLPRLAILAGLLTALAALAQEPAQKPAPAPAAIAAPSASKSTEICSTPEEAQTMVCITRDIGKLQRDLLLREAQMKNLVDQFEKLKQERQGFEASLGAKVGEAGKLCKLGEIFDALKLGCDKPAVPAAPSAPPK